MSGDRIVQLSSVLRDELVSLQADVLPAESCAGLVVALSETANACAYARALIAKRAIGVGAHRAAGVANPVDWMAGQTGMSAGQCRNGLKHAEMTADHGGGIADMAALGQLSMDQAAEIIATIADVPDAEDDMVDHAKGSSLDDLRDRGRTHRHGKISPDELHDRQRRLRAVRHFTDGDGMVCVHAKLVPELGAVWVARLKDEAARLRRQARADGGQESWAAHMADAYSRLVGLDPTHPTSGTRSPNVELDIVVDLAALVRGHVQDGEVCHIVGGSTIPVEVARHYATDAFVNGVLFQGTDIVSIKRFGRRYPAALLTALNLGKPPTFDGRKCVDCGSGFRPQKDHVNPVANGGMTEIANLQWRCPPCHDLKTEKDRILGKLGSRAPTPTDLRKRRKQPKPPRRPGQPRQKAPPASPPAARLL